MFSWCYFDFFKNNFRFFKYEVCSLNNSTNAVENAGIHQEEKTVGDFLQNNLRNKYLKNGTPKPKCGFNKHVGLIHSIVFFFTLTQLYAFPQKNMTTLNIHSINDPTLIALQRHLIYFSTTRTCLATISIRTMLKWLSMGIVPCIS